jgi:hypothetical protein
MGFDLNLSLPVHLSIHFLMAVLSGLLIGLCFKKEIDWRLALLAGILGGFLIDIDHVLEYFFVFGPTFNLSYFIEGREFLVSDKIRLVFHGFEYFPLLLFFSYLFRRKKNLSIFLLTLAFALFVHLISDSFINNYPPRNYSIIYRASKGFSAPALLSVEQYSNNLELKAWFGL